MSFDRGCAPIIVPDLASGKVAVVIDTLHRFENVDLRFPVYRRKIAESVMMHVSVM